MTEAPTLLTGRLLAGWWRDLAPWRPARLWHASLLLHQVEVLAAVARPAPLDPVQRALLRAYAAAAAPGVLAHLHLDRQLQHACLRELRDAGLVQETSSGRHELTTAGQRALERGQGAALERCRCVFPFLDNSSLGRAPHFLRLDLPADPAPTASDYLFDPCHLRHAVQASPEWKARHHFPAEVVSIFGVSSVAVPADWRRVILDRPEQRSFLLVETKGDEKSSVLCGFLADRATGRLLTDRPVFRLEEGWHEVFPDLETRPSAEAWRRAWETWCRALPEASPALAAGSVEYTEAKLVVRMAGASCRWLRDLAGDPLGQEGWVLAGAGRMGWAAPLEVVES